MSIFSNWTNTAILNLLNQYTYNVSLHTSDPNLVPNNPASTEISGGSYSRQLSAFSISSNSFKNSAEIVFAGLPATTITYVGAWYASGPDINKLAFAVPLSSSVNVSAGSVWSIAANAFSISA